MATPTHVSADVYQKLNQLAETATLSVVGHEELFDVAEIRLMSAVIAAYGQAATRGFIYSEPSLLDARIPPPDVVIAHPALGVVIFESKAYEIGHLLGAEAGNLKIMRYGRESTINPLRQARRGMFAIKDAYERFAPPGPRPLFHAMVAFPNIAEHEWQSLGYSKSIDTRFILFAEHINNVEALKERLAQQIAYTTQRVGKVNPLPAGAERILRRVFGDSAVINNARRDLQTLKPDSLGADIVAMEQAHKQLSPQQEQLSRQNVWGHAFLVRGVAGSGKSIVLANQVARTLYRLQKQHQQLSLFDDNDAGLPKIAVMCFNRSLVALLKERIRVAFEALTGQADLPDNVIVTDLNQLLYKISQQTDHFNYVTGGRIGRGNRRHQRHFEQLETLRDQYPDHLTRFQVDAMFIDEGQDASPDEFNILRLLVRPNPDTGERTIAIFYDDAQNLYGNPPPTWRDLSLNITGGRAAFMDHSYRNSREVLELGLNVLLGTHARQRVRVATRRFADVVTLQEKSLVTHTKNGWRVHFSKAAETEPIVRAFDSRYEQIDWVAEALVALLDNDGVLPEHILVLAPRVTSFQYLSQRIAQLSIGTPPSIRIVGGRYQQHINELLMVPDYLTMSTIYAAKGYDAPIVVMLDTDMIPNTVLGRAQFYVGVTRAKRYLLVTGINLPNTLMREALATQEHLQD